MEGHPTSKETVLFSIVVPVYNCQQYVERAIVSVMAQTYSSFELLLVDDGSTDSSGRICDAYSARDNRVKAYHKDNGGVSSARNFGLENVSGEWVCFLDADDWWEDTFLENFFNVISSDVDLLLQGYIEDRDAFGKGPIVVSFPRGMGICPGDLIAFLYKKDNANNGYIWHRLFRRSILLDNDIRFDESLPFAEDGLFFFSYLKKVRNAITTEAIGYHYVRRAGSLTGVNQEYLKINGRYLLEKYIEVLSSDDLLGECVPETQIIINQYKWNLILRWGVLPNLESFIDWRDACGDVIRIIHKYNINSLKEPLEMLLMSKLNKTSKLFYNSLLVTVLYWKVQNKLHSIRASRAHVCMNL